MKVRHQAILEDMSYYSDARTRSYDRAYRLLGEPRGGRVQIELDESIVEMLSDDAELDFDMLCDAEFNAVPVLTGGEGCDEGETIDHNSHGMCVLLEEDERGPDGCWPAVNDPADAGAMSDEPLERVLMVPCKFEVCNLCDGKGTHVNPSIDAGGLSAEDFAEDPDFREDYFSGMYDIPCNKCSGKRVTPVVELPKEIQAAVDRWEEGRAEERSDSYHERMMGA